MPRIYRAVIDDVIKNVREAFLNEGVDDQVLQELKQLWENKLIQSRAIDYMPTDVNVRVSLTYPHNIPQMQGHEQQQQPASSHQQPTPQQQPSQSTASQFVQNQAGQLVYVSSHPTLGNVGQMSGAAAQAAIALRNVTPQSTTLLPHQIAGLQQAQVIQVHQQGNQAASQQATMFPGYPVGRGPGGPRIIYAPTQQQQQQQHQKPSQVKQQVIQVDGANDEESKLHPLDLPTSEPSSSGSKRLSKQKQPDEIIIQLDGANDSSSDEFDDDDEDFDNYPVVAANNPTGSGEGEEEIAEEEDPLCSEDDVSDEDPTDLFDTDNVVVCQYDKIARVRNRWKFHLKDGIMNLKNKDYVFHKANGDSEW